MDPNLRPFVQVVVDGVHAVLHDPEGRFDPELYDRHATFEQARDAALSCIEDILDTGDADGPEHEAALRAMHAKLDAAESFQDLSRKTTYRRLLARAEPAQPAAA